MVNFKIEQIAICPPDQKVARDLLSDLGMNHWTIDNVIANGTVRGRSAQNTAELSFNYQADQNNPVDSALNFKPIEFEVLKYFDGDAWTKDFAPSVSHLGMHVSEDELFEFMEILTKQWNIDIAQEVVTSSHTNPHIANSRRYHYVIFNTRPILGVDLKFIVRKPK